MPRSSSTDFWFWCLLVFAAGNLGNAVWMIADPAGWYVGLPAAVPDTGPLNTHFVRDIGSAFGVMGVALVWAALRPVLRVPMIATVSLFYLMHALVHVTDTVAGRLPASHWSIDFPGVYAPALVLIGLTLAAQRSHAAVR